MYTFYIRQDVKHLLTKDPHEIKSILCYLKAHYHFIPIERSPPNYSFKRKCFGPRQKYPPSSSIVRRPLLQFMAPSFPLLSVIKLESLVVYPQVPP